MRTEIKAVIIGGLFVIIAAGLIKWMSQSQSGDSQEQLIHFKKTWNVVAGYTCPDWGDTGWVYASINYSGEHVSRIDRLSIYKGNRVFARTTGKKLEAKKKGDGLECGLCDMVYVNNGKGTGGVQAKSNAWNRFVNDWATESDEKLRVEYNDVDGNTYELEIPSFIKMTSSGARPSYETVSKDPDVRLTHDDGDIKEKCKAFAIPCKSSARRI